MQTEKLQTFFQSYLKGFLDFDFQAVQKCYQWPCTLNTPDKCVYIENLDDLAGEFNDIFSQLKQADTRDIRALKASFTPLNESLLLACVDWQFLNSKGEVFTDFSAIYHLQLAGGELKIINVISHDLSNSIALGQSFLIEH
ncbi:hypothetical protein SG34_017780 [Thalassomonas viridans]|uniref:Uncharacterized protein n=1 Tax=Thalassomonas viridans TaxID=137584 RepID=A0AAE9YYF8_9GAMM|nr:hypothetical protein [Thalassomonas viridans]WDE03243.1 hypothetical protein SG34_017780 [Thalassomonas viridans]